MSPELSTQLETPGIIVDDPYSAYAKISSLFAKHRNPYADKSLSYFVHETAEVHDSAVIGPNDYIGPECIIGRNSIVHANSSLVMNVEIGKNCIIHFNSILGSDGFGYAPQKDGYIKIEQLGRLIIGDNVEIGAGCTIDRGAIDNTEIHNGVKLDNQVHIAHNNKIGNNCIIAGQVGLAGSSTLGNNVMIGGQAGVSGHLKVGNNVQIGGGSGVIKDIPDNTKVMGYPAKNLREFIKDNR